jgi:hypothetical protein
MVTTKSTLSVADVAYVLEVLQQVQNLKYDATPAEIGVLNARAFAAAATLRIHSGIDRVIVPIKEEA